MQRVTIVQQARQPSESQYQEPEGHQVLYNGQRSLDADPYARTFSSENDPDGHYRTKVNDDVTTAAIADAVDQGVALGYGYALQFGMALSLGGPEYSQVPMTLKALYVAVVVGTPLLVLLRVADITCEVRRQDKEYYRNSEHHADWGWTEVRKHVATKFGSDFERDPAYRSFLAWLNTYKCIAGGLPLSVLFITSTLHSHHSNSRAIQTWYRPSDADPNAIHRDFHLSKEGDEDEHEIEEQGAQFPLLPLTLIDLVGVVISMLIATGAETPLSIGVAVWEAVSFAFTALSTFRTIKQAREWGGILLRDKDHRSPTVKRRSKLLWRLYFWGMPECLMIPATTHEKQA